MPYAKVTDKIKDYLVQQKTEKLAPAYLAGLTKDADVEILDRRLECGGGGAGGTGGVDQRAGHRALSGAGLAKSV